MMSIGVAMSRTLWCGELSIMPCGEKMLCQ
jgi:hypothetical protein